MSSTDRVTLPSDTVGTQVLSHAAGSGMQLTSSQPVSLARRPEIRMSKDAVKKEAQEEGFPIPSNATFKCAAGILSKLPSFYIDPSEVEIYPMPSGEIAVHICRRQQETKSAILFLCQSSTVRCLTRIKGTSKKEEFPLGAFPTDFVFSAFGDFRDLGHERNSM